MVSRNLETIRDEYLKVYRDLLVTEPVDHDSMTLSFPFHFASNHRVEITVTELRGGLFLLSDSARTIGELRESGYVINKDLRERIVTLARIAELNVTQDHLVMQSSKGTLGMDIQRFLEAAKTIGDVYFVHRVRPSTERELVRRVKTVLDARHAIYKENAKVGGEIENHSFDFLIPPNGTPGLAIEVLAAQNTHNAAQVWGFKCDDIRRSPANKNLRLGIVYDTTSARWSEESRRILESRASLVLPDARVDELAVALGRNTKRR
jgi:hypothetical protein